MRSEAEIRKVLKDLEERLYRQKMFDPFEIPAIASLEASIEALRWVLGESDSPRP